MFLPQRCVVCEVPGGALCSSCAAQLVPAPVGSPVPALVAYQGVGRAVMANLKYRGARGVIGLVADGLARLAPAGVQAVTWAPTSAGRRQRRGFDQAELLARAVARRLGVPARRLLVRRAGDSPQTGQGRDARLVGPSFVAVGLVPGRVLVVDDIVTTGATLAAACTALRVGGAHRVWPVAVAATP